MAGNDNTRGERTPLRDDDLSMLPTPTPEQRRLLEAMVGTWFGDETLYPSPWDPKGGTAIGRTQSRPVLDGLLVCADYVEERDGAIVFRGHGLYGWDAVQACYTMYWFDSMGPCPRRLPAIGQFEDGAPPGMTRLAFTVPGDTATTRYVYDFAPPLSGYYEFRIEMREGADGPWRTVMRGEYARQ
ncbi:MAG: DUF1579 domain-containing protein [Myxococcales bacterium]|nr:DUF1579 domain-containing protein [Myxococcales bacterium]